MAFECLAVDMFYPSHNQHTIEVTGTPVLSKKWTFCGNSQVSIFWLVSWTKNAKLWRVIMSGMMRYIRKMIMEVLISFLSKDFKTLL